MKAQTVRYTLTVTDTGDDACNLTAELVGPKGQIWAGTAPLVPLLNQVKSTLCDDLESRL